MHIEYIVDGTGGLTYVPVLSLLSCSVHHVSAVKISTFWLCLFYGYVLSIQSTPSCQDCPFCYCSIIISTLRQQSNTLLKIPKQLRLTQSWIGLKTEEPSNSMVHGPQWEDYCGAINWNILNEVGKYITILLRSIVVCTLHGKEVRNAPPKLTRQ